MNLDVYLNGVDPAMYEEQIRLEESMTRRGAEAYQRNVNNAQAAGHEDQTAYGTIIIAHRLTTLAAAIDAWQKEMKARTAGKKHVAMHLIADVAVDKLAYLTLRAVVGGLTQPRTLQYVTTTIGGMVEDELRFRALREIESVNFNNLRMGVAQRIGYDYKRIYALRIAKENDNWTSWTWTQKLHVGAKLLDLLMASIGLVQVDMQREGRDKTVKYVVPTPDTLSWIDRRNDALAMLRPAYEPMVIPPRPWDGAYGGGYITSHIPPLPMVKVRSKAYLEDLGSAEMPVVYMALNAIQRTPWQINGRVLAVMNHLWDASSTLGGLPAREGIEPPAKPFDIDTNEHARRDWRIKAAKVRVRNMSAKGARIALNMTLSVANRYAKYDNIYFPYQLDFRGRIYAVTTLSPQGSDFHKGLLRFGSGKKLGEHGGKWLAYQGANLAGNDKVSLEERVQWILDNEETILACAADPLTNTEWCGEIAGISIDSPWQFLAFCFEWADYCEQGDDYVSHLPIAMDGTCSGIQHFSAMLRDSSGGAAVNLMPSELPQDVYRIVAEKVQERLACDLQNGADDSIGHHKEKAYKIEGTKTYAKQWTEFGVTRKVTKRPVMTLAYGSKEYGFRQQLMEDIVKPAMDSATDAAGVVDPHAFPFTEDGYKAAGYMAHLIWEAVTSTLVAATDAMKWLQEAATLAASEDLPVRWETPVGFPVMQKYEDTLARRIDTVIAGKVVKLTIHEEQPTLSRAKMANSISPNFVHSCDAAHMMLTVARGSQAGIDNFAVVHDSFGTSAADMEVFYEVVRDAFVEIYEGTDVLGSFRDDIHRILKEENQEKLRSLPPKGDLEIGCVKDSRYCFA